MFRKLFTPAKMFHAKLVLSRKYVTPLTEALLENGVCQLKKVGQSEFITMFKQDLIKDFNGIMSRYKFVNDTLNDYKELVQPESLIKSVFFPKAPEKFNVIAPITLSNLSSFSDTRICMRYSSNLSLSILINKSIKIL